MVMSKRLRASASGKPRSGRHGPDGSANGPGQNGRELPLSRQPVPVEDYKDLTDKELTALANGHHRAFCGSLRMAVVGHARVAGAALVQLKSRLKHGTWAGWLKENFKGSAASARLYIRVAKNWHLIVEQGLDREGMTLEDLTWVLSESPGPRPGSKEAKEKKAKKKSEPDAGEETADPHNRQVPLYFNEDDAEEFEEMVKRLGVAFKTENTTDTVREAVRRCYKEVTRGND
jgi:hypothetical protein